MCTSATIIVIGRVTRANRRHTGVISLVKKAMHPVTLTLIIILALLGVVVIVLLAVMWQSRPGETEEIAGDPAFGQIDLNELRNHASRFSLDDPNALGPDMTDDEVQAELNRLVQEVLQQPQVGTIRVIRRVPRSSAAAAAAATAREQHGVPIPDPSENDRRQRASQILDHLTHTSDTAIQAGQADVEETEHSLIGEGIGIVVCAGGFVYGTCALVQIQYLREEVKCTLPIEVWHRNGEMPDGLREALLEYQPLEVRNVDQICSFAFQSGYATQPLACYFSKFQRILCVDADNLIVSDPTTLLQQADDQDIFWPDYWPTERNALCWQSLTEAQKQGLHRIRWTQESGQVLIDKSRSLRALDLCCKIHVQLAVHLKRLFPGPRGGTGQDVWQYAWLATDTDYTMTSIRPAGAGTRAHTGQYLGTTIVSFDHNHDPMFVHKTKGKWPTQTDRPQWTEVHEFVHDKAGSVNPFTHQFGNGVIDKKPFPDVFGDLEDIIWSYLEHWRQQSWYQSAFRSELEAL